MIIIKMTKVKSEYTIASWLHAYENLFYFFFTSNVTWIQGFILSWGTGEI